jgi:hypothetical protein
MADKNAAGDDSKRTLVYIGKVEKLALLRKLWVNSWELHPKVVSCPTHIPFDEKNAWAVINRGFIDYYCLHAIRCDLSGDFVDPTQWNAMTRRHNCFKDIVDDLLLPRTTLFPTIERW